MISNTWMKRIKSLHLKKYRQAEQLFFVEGEKAVKEVLNSDWQVKALFATEAFLAAYPQESHQAELVQSCSATELSKAGTFSSNDSALAVVAIPETKPFQPAEQWALVLDQINDPGNLGTLIRIADWYGIKNILCSPDTTDCFNPKVVAAAKGSFLRVTLCYQPLEPLLANSGLPVYGAYLQGESVHQLSAVTDKGFILLGNEAHGIRPELESFVHRKITIPCFGQAESLNVGIAAAIICDNIRRINALS